jgi:hypothetical protein
MTDALFQAGAFALRTTAICAFRPKTGVGGGSDSDKSNVAQGHGQCAAVCGLN